MGWDTGWKREKNEHRTSNGYQAEWIRFWTAVAERSGDTALERCPILSKRRGAPLPAALQNPILQKCDNSHRSIRQHGTIQLMKTKCFIWVALLAAIGAAAQTNDLTPVLQQGLFEEEANRDFGAAVSNYQALVVKFDQDRQMAATAIFRLGECYRKLGRTNDAVVQYQRIVRDFADQQTLVTLSQQNLNALHAVVPPRWIVGPQLPAPAGTFQERLQAIIAKAPPGSGAATSTDSAAKAVELEAEAAQLKAQVGHLSDLKREERLVEVQQNYPNPVLTKLVQDLTDAEQKLAVLTNDYSSQDLHVTRVTALIDAINGQIDTQVNGVIVGLRAKMDADLDAAKMLRAQAGSAPSARPADVTDDEAKEIQRIQQMIQNSPDLINAERGGDAPLYAAAGKGQLRVASFLLDHGANIEGVNQHVPLIAASINGNRAMVELLLSRGADVNAKGGAGDTALHQAALHGYQAVAEVLLANHADVNAPNVGGSTPLFSAASSGQLKIVQMLLAAGANSNLRDRNGSSPLSYAIGKSPEIFQALLDAGTNPNTEDSDGRTSLSYAAERNNPMIVKLLLDAKADPNGGKKDRNGRGALHYAIANNSPEIVQALSGAGADVNGEDSFGRTPLSYAAERNNPMIVKLLLDAKADPNGGKLDAPIFQAIKLGNTNILESLLQSGANPNAKGAVDWGVDFGSAERFGGGKPSVSPLFLAVSMKQLPSVQLLLKFQADPNDSQTGNPSPLFWVLEKPDIVRALLDAGAKAEASETSFFNFAPGQSQIYNETLLQKAASQNLAETVALLLQHGANPNAREERGNTALHYAAFNLSDEKVFALLLDHKADPNLRNNNGKTPLDLLKDKMAQNSPPGAPNNNIRELKAIAGELADLLRQHGALDNLPDWDRIEVSRPSANYSETVFQKGTNDWNRFTVLELIAQQYGFITSERSGPSSAFGVINNQNWIHFPLSFPDFKHVVIHRPAPDGRKWTSMPVDIEAMLESGDCSRDVSLQWGDVVEIPETDHRVSDEWQGFPARAGTNLIHCIARSVQIVVQERSTEFKPALEYVTLGPSVSNFSRIGSSFMVRAVLDQSKLIRFSSDLSRVKVTRRDPKTGRKIEWVLDCRGAYAPDLWLRDGDVIEVPEK